MSKIKEKNFPYYGDPALDFKKSPIPWGAREKRLYGRFKQKYREIEERYRNKMLAISEEFRRNKENSILTRKDCQKLYNEAKKPIELEYDRQTIMLEDWYETEKEKLQ